MRLYCYSYRNGEANDRSEWFTNRKAAEKRRREYEREIAEAEADEDDANSGDMLSFGIYCYDVPTDANGLCRFLTAVTSQ